MDSDADQDSDSDGDGDLDPATDDWSSDDGWADDRSATWHHDSVVQPMGWRSSRRRQRMPRTPLGWAAWGVAVAVVLVVFAAFHTSDGLGGETVPDSGPVDPALVRAEAATACGVPASEVSAPGSWSHGDVEDPLADGQTMFYDVPVSDGAASATVMLADSPGGWAVAGVQCDR